jgi:hypothetical protein
MGTLTKILNDLTPARLLLPRLYTGEHDAMERHSYDQM